MRAPTPLSASSLAVIAVIFLGCLLASGCGGGGGRGADSSPVDQASTANDLANAAQDATDQAVLGGASTAPPNFADASSDANAKVAGPTEPTPNDSLAANGNLAALLPVTAVAADSTATVGIASDGAAAVADASIRSAPSSAPAVTMAVGPTATILAALSTASTSARTYYVDSQSGSDSANGLAATTQSATQGPWRTLARVARATLNPGDRVVLACGSRYSEPLVLRQSGSAAQQISVGLPAGGCASAPVIDGSVELPPSTWRQRSGRIYSAALAQQPLQLHGSDGLWPIASFPNRGFDASRPNSPYLTMAGNGETVTVNGRQQSTTFVAGADLLLPTGAAITPGTIVRIRTNAWTIEERRITSASGRSYRLDSPTVYPAVAGWGYYLIGRPWMIDAPGEWAYDSTTGQVQAWIKGSSAPASSLFATIQATGIDLQGTSNVTVEGIRVRRVGTGVSLRGTSGVTLRALTIEDTAGLGVDAVGSVDAIVSGNQFTRTGLDAVLGVGGGGADASRLTVTGNAITDSGTQVLSDGKRNLPLRSFATIYGGPGAVIDGNTITNSGYIGIRFMAGSRVEHNVVTNSCLVLDDCGAIYTWGTPPNNSTVRYNIVNHVVGNLDGAPSGINTAAQGIYLDDYVSGVLVEGNTVVDADNGIQVHVANNNTLRANRLYGNRRSQIWLQEDSNQRNNAGDVFGNLIDSNILAPVQSSSVALRLDTVFASTSGFGRFTGNRYLDGAVSASVTERTKSGARGFTTAQWQASSGVGSTQPVDRGAFSQRAMPYTNVIIAGGTLIGNGNLASGLTGWSHWNQTPPSGSVLLETCAPGRCVRYVPGGSAGLVSSPNFSVQQGQWYRLTVDVRADTDGQPVNLLVRRGGGGSNGYESLSDRSLFTVASTTWRRYAVLFQATKTVRRADALTGDNGARVDVENLSPGHSVSLANLELVPVTVDNSATAATAVVINATAASSPVSCPLTGGAQAQCASLLRASTAQLAGWPFALDAYSGEILYLPIGNAIDSDQDGIPDAQDRCPGTPLGAPVNAAGCALGQ